MFGLPRFAIPSPARLASPINGKKLLGDSELKKSTESPSVKLAVVGPYEGGKSPTRGVRVRFHII